MRSYMKSKQLKFKKEGGTLRVPLSGFSHFYSPGTGNMYSHKDIELVLGKRGYKKFVDFMIGKTQMASQVKDFTVFECDLYHFLLLMNMPNEAKTSAK